MSKKKIEDEKNVSVIFFFLVLRPLYQIAQQGFLPYKYVLLLQL